MTIDEITLGLQWLAALDSRYSVGGDAERLTIRAKAWWDELPTALTVDQFQWCCRELLRNGQPVNPGTIFDLYRRKATKPHDAARGALVFVPTPSQPHPREGRGGEPITAGAIDGPARPQIASGGDPQRPLTGPETTGLINRLGLIRRRTAEGSEAMAVRCPHCSARPHQPCVNPHTRRPLTQSPCHPARQEAWEASREGDDDGTGPTEVS